MPIIYIALSLLLIGGAVYSPARAETGAQPSPATAKAEVSGFDRKRFKKEVVEAKDLPNFQEVHPYLLRSGAPTEAGMQDVKAKGVKTIIDLRSPGERRFDESNAAKQLGIKYISMPMSSEPPTKKQVETFMSEVKQAETHPEDGKVLVHCAHGSDRTGCMVGLWRVTHDGWNYDEAYKEMRKYWFTPKFTKLSGTVEQYAQHHAQ